MKLTVNNYQTETAHVNTSDLPDYMQEAHRDFDKYAKLYNKDDEIKELIDMQIEDMKEYLEQHPKKTTRKKIVPKSDKFRVSLNEGSYQFDQYFSTSSSLKTVHNSAIVKMQEMLDHRATDQSVWATIDEKINGSWEEVDRIKYKAKGEKAPTKPKPKTTKKTAPKKAATKTKTSKGKKVVRKPNEVAVMPEHIRILKRYLAYDGKKVTERQVMLFYRAIQRAAVEKKITKKTEHADLIEAVGRDLSSTYKNMGDSCVFEAPKNLKSKVEKVVDDYGIKPSIALIKRFINLYGGITPEKAQRLLKSIENAKKNGKVQKTDSTFKRITEIENKLANYLDTDKLIITDVQLNGLAELARIKK